MITSSLREELRREAVVPFVGAGVSMAVRERHKREPLFPNWPSLLARAADKLAAEGRPKDADDIRSIISLHTDPDYPGAAQRAWDGLGQPAWRAFIKEQFDRRKYEADDESLALAEAVWQLSDLVVTTNYDRVMRWACPDPSDVDIWDLLSTDARAEYIKQQRLLRPTIWHLHGSVSHVDHLVLTRPTYERLYGDVSTGDDEMSMRYRAAADQFRTLCQMKTLLFVGFSLADDHIGAQLEQLATRFFASSRHFILVRSKDRPAMSQTIERLGLVVVEFEDFDTDLLRVVMEMARERNYLANPERGSALERRAGVGPPTLVTRRGNVVAPDGQLIGRQRELAQATAALRATPARVVSVWGEAGVGRTYFCLSLASGFAGELPGGCWSVGLFGAASATETATAVAGVLDVITPAIEGDRLVDFVGDLLQARSPMLLVLDDLDEETEEVVETLRRWRAVAPECRFVVSSRGPLDVEGELSIRLTRLGGAAPAPVEGGVQEAGSDAEHLFYELLKQFPQADLRLQDEGALGDVLSATGGLPAAIRVLVAQAAAGNLVPIADALHAATADQSPSDQDRGPLDAVLQASLEALDEPYQQCLVALSAFQGRFDGDAADAVTHGIRNGADLAVLLTRLGDLGLLYSDETSYGRRHRMMDRARMFAREWGGRRFGREVLDCAEARRAEHLVQVAASWNARMDSSEGDPALDLIEANIDELLNVHDWAHRRHLHHLAASALLAMARTVRVRRPALDLRALLQRTDEEISDKTGTSTVVRLKIMRALFSIDHQDFEAAAGQIERAVELARLAGDRRDLAEAHFRRGSLRSFLDDRVGALDDFNAAKELFESAGDRLGAVWVEFGMGNLAQSATDFASALEHFDQALRLHELAKGSRHFRSQLLQARGACLAQGRSRLKESADVFLDVERLCRRLQNATLLATALANRAYVLTRMRVDPGEALDLLNEAEQLYLGLGRSTELSLVYSNRARLLLDTNDRDGTALVDARRAFEVLKASVVPSPVYDQYRFITGGILVEAALRAGDEAEAWAVVDYVSELSRSRGFDENHAVEEVASTARKLKDLEATRGRDSPLVLSPATGPEVTPPGGGRR